MSSAERHLRSRAAQLLSKAGLLHGHLATRYQTCGKPNCRCARGEKHEVFVLVLHEAGQTEQIPVPRRLEPAVRRWVEQERSLQGLLAKLSDLHTRRLRDAKQAAPGG
jgi:hypothetical protein